MKNKKWFWIALIIFSTVELCYAQKENNKNTEVVKTWIKNLTDHDTVTLANMYADSAVIESPNWKGSKKGPLAIREIYSRYFTTSPDLKHNITNIFTNDNAIVIEYTFSGTMVNLEKDSPEYMRGKKYTLSCCTRMNIENGKITAQAFYFDQVAFLQQVGFFGQK